MRTPSATLGLISSRRGKEGQGNELPNATARTAAPESQCAAANPDLRAFKAAGGKLVMWQGLADQLIFTGDSINYYNRMQAFTGTFRPVFHHGTR
jgi:hypothetical protein